MPLANPKIPGFDATAIHADILAELSALATKSSLVAGDLLIGEDSENSFSKIKIPLSALTDAAIQHKASGPYTVTSDDQGSFFTNKLAASEVEFVLLAAAEGLGPYFFYNQNVNGIKITAGASDTIRLGPSLLTGLAGSVIPQNPSDVGALIVVVAIDNTEWVAFSVVGSWSVAP